MRARTMAPGVVSIHLDGTISIPTRVVEKSGWKPGELVIAKSSSDGSIVVRKLRLVEG